MVDGRIVMEGRRLTTVDEDEVLERANRAFRDVVGRMEVPELEAVAR
jgi:hypothetical protein